MPPTPPLNQAFAAQLQLARKTAGLTQEELAFAAHLDRTYISLLERAKKLPTLDSLFRLCGALGQEPEAFIARVRERMAAQEDQDNRMLPSG